MNLPADPFAADPPMPTVARVVRGVVSLPAPLGPAETRRPVARIVDQVRGGGQTGVDQGALRGAHAAGIDTRGWAPRRWLTETGPAPWLATWGLRVHPEPGYPPRTVANVRDSDGTVIIGDRTSTGSAATIRACTALGRPYLVVGWRPGCSTTPRPETIAAIRRWLTEGRIRWLNVAGNRESRAPGIAEAACELVRLVLTP
jgi:hypothetical protein